MKNITNLIAVVVILGIILINGCVKIEKPIGGERDEYGCLSTAGYTWNEEIGACIREWELNENQRKAAKKAVEYIGYAKGITVLGVDVARCPGCFLVHLEKGKDRIDVTLENWEIKGKTLTPEECIAKGGKPVNTVGGVTCEENEKNIGKVTGFISPHICCLQKSELTLEEAMEIAESSKCTEKGTLTDDYVYNEVTKTWWIDLDMKEEFEREGCNPACVVKEDTKTAGINWRCTGVLPMGESK